MIIGILSLGGGGFIEASISALLLSPKEMDMCCKDNEMKRKGNFTYTSMKALADELSGNPIYYLSHWTPYWFHCRLWMSTM
jgi:hypothetical protein